MHFECLIYHCRSAFPEFRFSIFDFRFSMSIFDFECWDLQLAARDFGFLDFRLSILDLEF